MTFSSALIIHQVRTKKITIVKEVWIPGLNKHRCWRFYFSVYSLVFVSIEKIYQTLETMFHRISKHLEFRQKYSAARRIFNSLLGVWISRWNTVARVWYITSKPTNHSIENLTNNGELETCDRQLLIQHQPRLRTYLTILKVIYNTVLVKKKLNSNFDRWNKTQLKSSSSNVVDVGKSQLEE